MMDNKAHKRLVPKEKFEDVEKEREVHDLIFEHQVIPELDHYFDTSDRRYNEEEMELAHHKVFKEVHHPIDEYDFGTFQDVHKHRYPSDYWEYPHHAAADHYLRPDYEHVPYPHQPYHHEYSQNTVPLKAENKLEGAEDAAICFVKAYARKPLGHPKENMKNIAANNIPLHEKSENYLHRWGDRYYDEYAHGD